MLAFRQKLFSKRRSISPGAGSFVRRAAGRFLVGISLLGLIHWPEKPILAAGATTPPGMLDLVLCIDHSGSMLDDIQVLQTASEKTLAALDFYAKTNRILLQVGLVVFTRHDETNWITATALTSDVAAARGAVHAIKIEGAGVGRGGNEDLYGALMYAMNQPVGGRQIAMGWRTGAAKILIPMSDEPPDEPDWEGRELPEVAAVAKALDPVHMYPLLTPKQGSRYSDSAVAAMSRLAKATDGEMMRVRSAAEVPEMIVATVKLAVRRHREEIWRSLHVPTSLYSGHVAIGLLALAAVIAASVAWRRRHTASQAAAAAVRKGADPRLTGLPGLGPRQGLPDRRGQEPRPPT